MSCVVEDFFLSSKAPKRAMLQADADLMESTTDTSRREDERCQRLDKCYALKGAGGHACRKLNEERKAQENRNC
jgi:hypothetical protein